MKDITHKRLRRVTQDEKNHIIYILTNKITKEQYVGISVCVVRNGVDCLEETLAARWCRHKGRAKLQNKNWNLCESIRAHGENAFKMRIHKVVSGKAKAHAYETKLRNTGKYTLNTV